LQVLEAITKLKGQHRLAEDAILRLNSSLLEITQVRNNFQHVAVSYVLRWQEIFPPPSSLYYLMVFRAWFTFILKMDTVCSCETLVHVYLAA
jgi:hypothetical protein